MYIRSLLLGALVLGCCALAQADPLPPPLGENLVGDCTFTDTLESTPWQAESGALADMLCPSGGCGNCAAQVNVLRFRGRDTDDILAVRQEIVLPAASSYELSFDLKYCDTRPTGTVSVSLGNFDLYTITIPTRPTSGVRNFVHTFDNSGESTVQPAGLAQLVIANPALDGADIMVDNVRIVSRYSGSQCTLDPALLGEWKRKVNGGAASEDTWHFFADGTFYLNAMRGYYDEENGECCIYGTDYQGVWCVDMAQTPPTIYLRVDNESIYESKSAKAEKVFEPDCGAPERAWYGRYQVDGGQLSLRVQECPNPTFDSPPVFLKDGFASDNGAPLIAPCDTPEGEDTVEAENTEGEGEGTVDTCPATPTADPAVVGNWGQKCVVYDGVLQFGVGQEWDFNADGTFTLTTTQYGDEWLTGTSFGTYTVNTSVSPAQMDLHTCETCFDDVLDEYEECDYCCFPRDYNQQAIYSIEGDILSIAKGNTRPATLSIDDQHKRDEPEYCPTAVEGETCQPGEAGDNALLGQWHTCLVPDVSPEENWSFREDGTFSYAYDWGGFEANFGSLSGTYTVYTDFTPYQIDLFICESCRATDEIGEGGGECMPCCTTPFNYHYGRYAIEGGELKIVTGNGFRPASLSGATPMAPGHSSDECESAEAEGEAINSLEGVWGRGVCDKDLELPNHAWTFNSDGAFQEVIVAVGAASVVRYSGTYEVNLETSPAQVDLHYTLRETYDDVVEEGEACGCAGGCFIDSCEVLDFTDLGVFEIVGYTLKLVTGNCRPESTDGAPEHYLYGTFCVSEEAVGEYNRGPGACGGEGEGPVDGEAEVTTEAESGTEAEAGTEAESATEAESGTEAEVGTEAENATEAESGLEGEGEGQTGPSLADIIEGFLAADGNNDRALSRTEAQALNIPPALFDSIDANEDGFIHVGEAFWAAGDTAPRHTSDQDLDGVIDLGELLRAIQFYNADGYSCAPFGESEDAYLPLPYAGGGLDPGCPAHASDYLPDGGDGKVGLSEILRIIQLFNAHNYFACPDTGEDRFCLG